jgi:DnaK suppressor protein
VKAKPSKPSKPAAKKPVAGKPVAKKPASRHPGSKPAPRAAAKPSAKVAAKPVARGKPTPPPKLPAKPAKSDGSRKILSLQAGAKKPTAKPMAPLAKGKPNAGAKARPQVPSKATKSGNSAASRPVARVHPKTAPKVGPKVAPKSKPIIQPQAPAKFPPKSQSRAEPLPQAKGAVPHQQGNQRPKPSTGGPAKGAAKAHPDPVPAGKSTAASAVAPAPAAPAAKVAAPPPPAKLSKASARLAALTVPGMGHVEASTAPKLTFTHADEPVVKPPLIVQVKRDPKLANNWKSKAAEQLTDAELLAMPDAEYMNDKQMAAFRHKLVVLKDSILSNAGETTEHLREETVIVPDPADRATIEEEHALELRTRDRERKLLKKIEQSIARIDAGDYGYCDETGEAIGVGRLLARPTATLSLEAQQRRELKQRMFGD